MLKISCLGPWQINLESESDIDLNEGGSRSITLQSRKEIALMAYLAVENATAHSRHELSGLFFPDKPEQVAQSNLRVVLSRLRNRLGPYAQYLLANRLEVQFQFDPKVCWLDTDALSNCIAQVAHTSGNHRLILLEQAAALARGDFLQGLVLKDCESFDQWLLLQRERHHIAIGKILIDLAQHYEAQHRYADVVATATRQLAINPFDEIAHRTLLKALAAQGKRAQALAQHNAFIQTLREELGISPSPETQALAEKTLRHQPPPARLTPSLRLPAQFTSFIGRKREVADIIAALTTPSAHKRSRLVSLLGDGGVGKTRTALQVAEACATAFADGVCFVALSTLVDARTISSAILQALKITNLSESQSPRDTLLYALRHRHLLLILDNAEHLLDGANAQLFVQLLLDVLNSAPNLALLITSRERLGMQAEDIFVLRGLPLPISISDPDNDAIQLFFARAKRVDKHFELNTNTLPHVQRICVLTGGMPLALELAAATLYHLPIEQLAATLAGSLDVLSASLHDLNPSHRSIRACFNDTWERLTEDEQNIAACLSVFAESFSGEAALAICQTNPALLEKLQARSLLATEMNNELRYSLHPLLRSFLREKLQAQGCSEMMSARHATYFHRWLRGQEDVLDGHQPRLAIDGFLADLGNVRAAWEHTITTHDTYSYVADSCRAYAKLAIEVNLAGEAIDTFTRAVNGLTEATLENANDEHRRTHVLLLRFLAFLEADSKANKQAIIHTEQVMQLAHGLQDPLLMADALSAQLDIYTTPQQHALYEELASRALNILDQAPPSKQAAKIRIDILQSLGQIYYHRHQLDLCTQIYEQTIQISKAHGLERQTTGTQHGLAALYFSTGRLQEAIIISERVIRFAQENRLDKMLNNALLNQAAILDAQGDYGRAQQIWIECMEWAHDVGNIRREAELCGNLGISHDYMGQYHIAIEYTQRSIESWRLIGYEINCDVALVNLALHLHHIGNHEAARQTALEAIDISSQYNHNIMMAYGQTMLGHAELALGNTDAAEAAYSTALELAQSANLPHTGVEPMAGLARVALQCNDLLKARERIVPILVWLDQNGADNLEEPFRVYLTCADVLRRNGESIDDLLARANAILNARAAKITDSDLRHSYLNNVQAHFQLRRMQAEAQEHASRPVV